MSRAGIFIILPLFYLDLTLFDKWERIYYNFARVLVKEERLPSSYKKSGKVK